MAATHNGGTVDYGNGKLGDAVSIVDSAGAIVDTFGGGASSAAGDVAHDAADSGNPIKIGGKAETTAPATVADGDRVNAWFDEYGRLVIVHKFTDGTLLQSANGVYQQGAVANNAADAGNPVKVGGVYNTTPPTLDNADRGDLQVDVNGNLLTAPGAVEVRSFFDAITNDVDISVKASAGYLMSVIVTNENAAVRWLQLHNKATAPANPDAPVMSLPIPAGTANNPGVLTLDSRFFGEGGRTCSTGIAIGISTTEATFTGATASEHNISGSYL